MLDAPLAYAFTAGLVATVNPCGFPMLPAYLSYFVGADDEDPGPTPLRVLRAVGAAAAVSVGFFIVFVGVINLAPIPPLDGGHLLVLALEKISRRTIDPKKVLPVAGVFLGFLAILTFALLFLDVARPVVNPFQ